MVCIFSGHAVSVDVFVGLWSPKKWVAVRSIIKLVGYALRVPKQFLPGIGVGMIRDPATLMLGQYFKRKRDLVEVVLVASSGVGLAVMSVLIQVSLG